MEDRDALLRHYRESRAALLAAIDGLTDAQMTDPSIDGWSVKDHLAHAKADIDAGVSRFKASIDTLSGKLRG